MDEPKYVNVPVDPETKKKLEVLCAAYEMGKRSQGAMVRKLVNAEWEKLAAVKLLPLAGDEEGPKNERELREELRKELAGLE